VIRGRSADDRRTARQERSKPLVLALKAWLEHQLPCVSAKATIAEHLRCALNQWDGLTQFLDDGRIEPDTKIVERSIRPVVLMSDEFSAVFFRALGAAHMIGDPSRGKLVKLVAE
jgi:hypothetical protein